MLTVWSITRRNDVYGNACVGLRIEHVAKARHGVTLWTPNKDQLIQHGCK